MKRMTDTIFIDSLYPENSGGIIKDVRKAEYLLATNGMSIESFVRDFPNRETIPSGGFTKGEFVILFNIDRDLKSANVAVVNSKIDLDSHFDTFADSMSPKAVAGFHQLKQQILSGQQPGSSVFLSSSEEDFQKAYESYLEYRSRQ